MAKTNDEESAHIQFRVPKSRADEFNNLAYGNFGLDYGGKTRMFLMLIDEYQKSLRIKHLRDEIRQLE